MDLRKPLISINTDSSNTDIAFSSIRHKSKLESLDYVNPESEVYFNERRVDESEHRMERWVLAFLIGTATACVGFGIDYIVDKIADWKFNVVDNLLDNCDNCFWSPFFVYVCINVGLVSLAAALVALIEPLAAGSGIPEIKSFLNGIRIRSVVGVHTIFAKAIGVLFSVAGGLPVGKEGPMIHSGAIIASGFSQARSYKLRCDLGYKKFRDDQEKRDFVSGGAAAGVAAAFGAPIGGVLFSLEEGASFWNQELTWRSFFCAMTCTFVINFLLSGVKLGSWGNLGLPGLVNFGVFTSEADYSIIEFPFFMIIAIIGGLLGAAFNAVNGAITKFRLRYIHTRGKRFCEALLLAAAVASISFCIPRYIHSCHQIPSEDSADFNPNKMKSHYCSEDGDDTPVYNDMATLLFNTQESGIKALFHSQGTFSPVTLVSFVFIYFSLACITYGAGVPSGLFIPCIMCGSAMGRLIGHEVNEIFPHLDLDPGTYALVGAAAFLGGVCRMTISLTVIVLESTQNMSYGMPIMATIMISKVIGDLVNIGIYDLHIELKHVPFLEFVCPKTGSHMRAIHPILGQKTQTVYPVARVGDICDLLCNSSHNGFPVIEPMESPLPDADGHTDEVRERAPGAFRGLILRKQLLALLHSRLFFPTPTAAVANSRAAQGESTPRTRALIGGEDMRKEKRMLTPQNFKDIYHLHKTIEDLVPYLSRQDLDMYMDLKPYMDANAHIIQRGASLDRAFRLFRTMGLRHLVVVNNKYQVVGILTRKDFCHLEEVEVRLKEDGVMLTHDNSAPRTHLE